MTQITPNLAQKPLFEGDAEKERDWLSDRSCDYPSDRVSIVSSGHSASLPRKRPCLPFALFLVIGICTSSALAFAQTESTTQLSSKSHVGSKTVVFAHLDTPLNEVALGFRVSQVKAISAASQRGFKIDGDRLHITLRMSDEASAEQARDSLTILGIEVTAHFGPAFEAWVPVSSLESLNDLHGLLIAHRTILLPSRPTQVGGSPKAGIIQSEGVIASNAAQWHTAGFSGDGVKVAFIDSYGNWAVTQLLGELPLNLFLYGTLNTGSSHGTACAEIIYDMAPGASITMASASGYVEFAQTITGLAGLGHDVIGSSQAPIEPGPGDGTGVLADAIDQATDLFDVVYVQSAGNQAKQHWDGYFDDPDSDGVHEWDGHAAEFNRFAVSTPTYVQVLLSWDDWPMSDQDYDLFLYYLDGLEWVVVDASINPQTGHQQPWEEISYSALNTGVYGLLVAREGATESRFLDLMMHTGGLEIEFKVPDRSLDDIAAAPSAISAAAVDYATFLIEDYSSRGPTYGPGGAPTGGYQQPRIAGYDKVSTLNISTFGGTSAASPHVVGAAALVRGAFPDFVASQVQSFMEGRALDRGALGYDHEYGHGRLWLGEAPVSCSYSISPTSRDHGAAGGAGSVAVSTADGCSWTAASNNPTWLTITSGSAGTGAGGVSYNVAENTSTSPRTGTLTIAGRTFTVTQAGAGQVADFTISDTNPDIGETVTFTAASGIQPTSWNFGGENCDGDSPQVDCSSVSGDCRVMQWEWSDAGTKAVTMNTAAAGSKTRSVTVNNAGSCPGSCDATGPPDASFTISPSPAFVNEPVLFTDTSTGTGPNAPTSSLWTIKKGGQIVRTTTFPSFYHEFGEAGLYLVDLKSSNCGYFDVKVAQLTVLEGPVGSRAWMVPSAVRTAGLNDTLWKTDLYVFNPGEEPADVDMVFLPMDTNNTQGALGHLSFTLEPKDTRFFRDVVTVFPLAPQTGAKGAILIEPDAGGEVDLVIGSRTYNETPEGTFGQFVPPVAVAAPPGDAVFLTGLTENERFRTNFGLVNLGPTLVNGVSLSLYDEAGRQLGFTFSTGVLPASSTQIVRVARYAGIDEDLDTFSVKIEPNGNNVAVYASVVDNTTGDPVFLIPANETVATCDVPGMAHLPGLNSSVWRSDITYFNPTGSALEAKVRYFPDGFTGWIPPSYFSLSSMQAISVSDVVSSFSHPPGENSRGHIEVSGRDGGPAPAVAARTYNLAPGSGTFGQNIFVYGGSTVLHEGQTGFMPGVCNSADAQAGSRTNIGVVNASTTMYAEARVTFWTESGTIVAPSKSVQLWPGEMFQANLFELLEIAGHDLCGTASVKVITGGQVAAYASIIDNRTQDPIMVPAIVVE